MGLKSVIEFIENQEKQLVLFNSPESEFIVEKLSSYFANQNLQITDEQTAAGAPTDLAILSSNNRVIETFDLKLFLELLQYVPPGSNGTGVADVKYESILSYVKETTFTSHNTKQLLYASREIEDRARRVSGGTIHAGFQKISLMNEQKSIYTDLARHGVDIHAYGIPDDKPSHLPSGTVHTVKNDEISGTWFVVFDGDGNDAQKTALIAEERSEDTYYGAWTYDPGIVDRTKEYLEDTYV